MNRLIFRIQISGMIALSWACSVLGADLMPIDPLWKSASFRKAFTGSYGIDSRIEPKVTTSEKSVLEAVAAELADKDRDGAAAKLMGSSLLKRSSALMFALGNLRFEQGEIEGAVENFETAVKLYPNFRDAHRNLAIAQVQQSEFKKAEPHLIRAIELGAQDGLTLGLLGYVHSNEDRHQAALQAFRLAQLTMPAEIQWKVGEAYALLSLDEPRAAASIYADVLTQQPTEAGIWKNQAYAFFLLEESVKGLANLEFASRLGKLTASETLSLGHLYLNETLYDLAKNRYEEAVKMTEHPASPAELIAAVEYLVHVYQWKSAKSILEGIRVIHGEKIDEKVVLQNRFSRAEALIELEIGNSEKGAALVAEILKKNPVDGEALILLAKFHLREAEAEEAVMMFEQAALIPESEAEARLEHGQILVNQGDYKAGIEMLKRSHELKPNPSIAEYIEGLREFLR